jgi:acyl-CoA thioesterase
LTEQASPPQPYEPANFSEMIGTEVVASGEGWGKVRMPIRPRHLQPAGVVQGGIIMTLADQALSVAVRSVHPDHRSVTLELKVNFIAPASTGELIGEGTITNRGNLITVGEVTITDGDGRLIARGLSTWMTLNNNQNRTTT